MALVAQEFGALPSAVARELERDPLQLNVACLELLRYGEAKRAFDRAKNDKALEPWKGSPHMNAVKVNTKALRNERLAKAKASRSSGPEARQVKSRQVKKR